MFPTGRSLAHRWRFLWLGMIAAAGIAGGLRTAPAAAESEDDAFMHWAEKLSEINHKTICAWGSLAHAASKTPGRFVWFVDKARPYASWLVFESGGRRWLFRDEQRADWGGKELRCEPGGGQVWQKDTALELDFSEKSNISSTSEAITFVDGELVKVRETQSGFHDADDINWIEGTHTWDDAHPLEDSLPGVHQRILFALPEGSRWWGKVPPAPVNVTFGAKRWTGKSDADLSVRVVFVPDYGVRVQLAATDDRAVLPAADADARAMVRADHFELWFCWDIARCDERPTQLGVARTAAGGALALWLRPPQVGGPVPPVSVEKDQLVVDLPRDLLGARSTGPALVPFTVAYSDSDDPAAGQETMVATAPLKKAKPNPPSLLSISDGGGPFPVWTKATQLPKGEAIFAEDPVCGERAVSETRAAAAASLKSGAYADAAARLDTLTKVTRHQCSGRLSPDTDAGIRIDLGLARHKTGDDAGCLDMLNSFFDHLSPSVARDLQFQRALCGDRCKDAAPGCQEGKAARAAKQ
jgi:hypothetical protein